MPRIFAPEAADSGRKGRPEHGWPSLPTREPATTAQVASMLDLGNLRRCRVRPVKVSSGRPAGLVSLGAYGVMGLSCRTYEKTRSSCGMLNGRVCKNRRGPA